MAVRAPTPSGRFERMIWKCGCLNLFDLADCGCCGWRLFTMFRRRTMRLFSFMLFGFSLATHGAAPASSSFLEVVRRYADTMIERGRDTYGSQKSGLLLSALD